VGKIMKSQAEHRGIFGLWNCYVCCYTGRHPSWQIHSNPNRMHNTKSELWCNPDRYVSM
jgi:ribosomal protein L37AE/L43A